MTAIEKPITRDDIEAKLRAMKDDVEEGVDRARNTVLVVGAVAIVAIAGAAFVMGRRRGRKRTTVVEVRRV
ncbi:MAG TPA: hypothetical protein VGA13_11265 [Acidimicrobiales bacterium]|jgi:signal transduction histidine kinase